MVFSASPRTVMSSVMRWRKAVSWVFSKWLGLNIHENAPMLSLAGEAVDDQISMRRETRIRTCAGKPSRKVRFN